jgi:hypothetical protein
MYAASAPPAKPATLRHSFVQQLKRSCLTGEGCQVAAITTHSFDYEHPPLCTLSRLSYSVTNFSYLIQSGVTPQRELRSWHIITDSTWNNHYGNIQGRIVFSVVVKLDSSRESLETNN